MSQDLAAMADRQAVRDVLERYFYAIDARDEHAVTSCFTADARAHYHKGAITEVFLENAGPIAKFLLDRTAVYSATNHTLSNASITIEGATARAVTHAIATVIVATQPRALVRGILYEDELVRDGSGWLIRHRTHIPVWQYEAPAVPPAIPVRK